MSRDFAKLKEKWDKRYITEDTLRKYVILHDKNSNVGISAEEFTLITGLEY